MAKKAVKKVRMKYLGIPNVKNKYVGDGLYCDTNKPDTCDVEISDFHAAKLLSDFPQEWEANELDLGGTPVEKFINDSDYHNKMIASATAKKGVVVTYPDGSEMTYPAGCDIKVVYPKDRSPETDAVTGSGKQQAWRSCVKKANGNMKEAKRLYKEMGY
jgi:hypothetical protein